MTKEKSLSHSPQLTNILCLSINPSIYSSVQPPIHPSIHHEPTLQFTNLSLSLSLSLSTYLPNYLSVYLISIPPIPNIPGHRHIFLHCAMWPTYQSIPSPIFLVTDTSVLSALCDVAHLSIHPIPNIPGHRHILPFCTVRCGPLCQSIPSRYSWSQTHPFFLHCAMWPTCQSIPSPIFLVTDTSVLSALCDVAHLSIHPIPNIPGHRHIRSFCTVQCGPPVNPSHPQYSWSQTHLSALCDVAHLSIHPIPNISGHRHICSFCTVRCGPPVNPSHPQYFWSQTHLFFLHCVMWPTSIYPFYLR